MREQRVVGGEKNQRSQTHTQCEQGIRKSCTKKRYNRRALSACLALRLKNDLSYISNFSYLYLNCFYTTLSDHALKRRLME